MISFNLTLTNSGNAQNYIKNYLFHDLRQFIMFSVHKGMIDTKVTQVSEFTFDKVVNATFGR